MTSLNAYSVQLTLNADGLFSGAKLARGELNALKKNLRDMQTPVEKQRDAFDQFTKTVAKFGDEASRFEEPMRRMRAELDKLENAQIDADKLKRQREEEERLNELRKKSIAALEQLTTAEQRHAQRRAEYFEQLKAGLLNEQEYKSLVKLSAAKRDEEKVDKSSIATKERLNALTLKHTSTIDKLRLDLNALLQAQKNNVKVDYDLAAAIDNLNRKIKQEQDRLAGLNKETDKSIPITSRLSKAFLGFAAAKFTVQGFTDLLSQADQANISLRQTEAILQSISGSDIQGSALIEDIRQLTRTMPLGFKASAEAAKNMMAYGFSAKEVIPVIRQVGMITAGNAERFAALTNAIAQMRGANRLMGQEVIQAVNAGWNPLAEISRNTGKSMSVLKKEMEEGAISFDMVAKALQTATSATGRFGNVSSKIMDSVAGKQALLASRWEEGLARMGRALEPLSIAIKDFSVKAIEGLTPLIAQMSQVVQAFDTLRSKSLGVEKMDLGKTFFGEDSAIARLGGVADFYTMLFSGNTITKRKNGSIGFGSSQSVEEMSKNASLMEVVGRMQKDFLNRQLLSNEHIAAYNMHLRRQTEEREKQNRIADRQAAIEKQRNSVTAQQAAKQEAIDDKFAKTIDKYKTRLTELKEGQVAAQMMKADMAGFSAEQMKAAKFWAESVASEERKLKIAKEAEKANQRIVDTFERYNKKYETAAERIGRETADIEELFMRGKITKQKRDEIQSRILNENLQKDQKEVQLPKAMAVGSSEFINYMNTLKSAGKTRQEQLLEAQKEIQKEQQVLQKKMLDELIEANKTKVQKAR